MVRLIRSHRYLLVVVTLFTVLGVMYSMTTPLFEAPDEQWHYAYVQHLALGRGLPVQTLNASANLARQEASQPPLYYALAAALTFWTDSSDFPGIVWENPHYGYNVPGVVNDNKNLFIHTTLETFPYRGASLAIHLGRLLSVIMGALAILFTYLLTLEIHPERRLLAASAAAVAGFVPQFIFVSGAVSNDSTIVAMSALSLWMIARALTRREQWSAKDDIVLGIAVGLAALAKVSGAGLGVLAAMTVAYAFARDGRKLLNHLSIFALAAFIVAGWWYLRNWFLYGEPTGTAMMAQVFGARDNPLGAMQLGEQMREVWETFWIGFGWGNIRANPTLYQVIGFLFGFSLVGLIVGLVRHRAQLSKLSFKTAPLAVLGIWVAFVLVELISWMQRTQAPHGRLLFPILPALGPLLTLGFSQWVSPRLANAVAPVPALGLATVSGVALFSVLLPAYAYPTTLSAADLQSVPNRVDITYGDQFKLLGYQLSRGRALPGTNLEITLYWQSLAVMDDDYSIGIHLLDANKQVISARDSYPGHGMLPTTLWYPGQTIRDSYWIPIAPTSAAGLARIQVDVYSRQKRRTLAAADPNGRVGAPLIGRLQIGEARTTVPNPQTLVRFIFGKQIEFLGYDQSGSDLTLYWKRIVPIPEDYTVFLHLLDDRNQITGQQDREPGNGNNPTSLWENGEIIEDTYQIEMSGLSHRIEFGLYRAATLERLPVQDSSGSPLGDRVILELNGAGQ